MHSIRELKPGTIEELLATLERPGEAACQRFLTRHPYLLLSAFHHHHCLPKFRLGAEFETDFALFSLGSMGLHATLVELEPPTARPYTRAGTYARRLNQAMKQIHDWFAWIKKNTSYFEERVRESLAGELREWEKEDVRTSVVDAKVIVGRRRDLTPRDDERRQAEFSRSQGMVEITNFDRLVDVGKWLCARSVETQESRQQLGRLGRSKFVELRLAVAKSDHVSPRTLAYLSEDVRSRVRSSVAGNPITPAESLSALAEDPERSVAEEAIRNPSCPAEVLVTAAGNADQTLRRAAASNPRLCADAQCRLSTDSDSDVRRVLARNPSLCADAQCQLSTDSDSDVRRVLARNPSLKDSLAHSMITDGDRWVRLGLYRKQNLAEESLVANLWSELSWIRGEIAQHPNLRDRGILARLTRERAAVVRAGVARNPNLSRDLRQLLLDDSNEKVRRAAESSVESEEMRSPPIPTD